MDAKLAKATKKHYKKAPVKLSYKLVLNVTMPKVAGMGGGGAVRKTSTELWTPYSAEPETSHIAAAALASIMNDPDRVSAVNPCLFVSIAQQTISYPQFDGVTATPWAVETHIDNEALEENESSDDESIAPVLPGDAEDEDEDEDDDHGDDGGDGDGGGSGGRNWQRLGGRGGAADAANTEEDE